MPHSVIHYLSECHTHVTDLHLLLLLVLTGQYIPPGAPKCSSLLFRISLMSYTCVSCHHWIWLDDISYQVQVIPSKRIITISGERIRKSLAATDEAGRPYKFVSPLHDGFFPEQTYVMFQQWQWRSQTLNWLAKRDGTWFAAYELGISCLFCICGLSYTAPIAWLYSSLFIGDAMNEDWESSAGHWDWLKTWMSRPWVHEWIVVCCT